MRRLGDVKAVLLDMDGTLVDSDAAVERAWIGWCHEYGVAPDTALAVVHGSPSERTIRVLRPDLTEEQVTLAASRLLDLEYGDLADLAPGVGAAQLLSALDRLGLPWAVVTSANARLAHARLGAAGITPPLLLTIDDVRAGKPDPEGYLRAAERLGVEPARCLVVEDSLPGLEAGRRAGALTAALRGHDGDLRLTDLAELARLLSAARDPRGWWHDAVGYQVYLPSFADADGDGWGDLPGVTARLGYLADLGVELLWLTPFFTSPMRDHGYDVADYRQVDPSYGGEAALADLLDQAHRRGLRVIGDLVVNHTSDQHSWFRSARASRDSAHRDYYLWRDPAPDGGPPNNWLSHFGGPAWTHSAETGQYYLHLFRPEQPDLNWRNPAVADEVDAILEHWLRRGVDGFRIDAAAYLVKHPELPDNPLLPDGGISPIRGVTTDWRRQDHRYDIHQPDVHAIHERWRRVADRYGAFLVGEVYELDPHALARFVDGERLHSSFWFGLIDTDWDHERIRAMVLSAADASPQLSWVQSNHDRPRAASRYGGGTVGRRRSLALHVLMAFLPGTTWLYQGEELGLLDGVVSAGQGHDPLAAAAPDQSRDAARTPMPWAAEPGLGFTTGTPWLPEGGRRASDTVAAQAADPASHLHAIRRLLATRGWLLHLDDIAEADLRTVDLPQLAAYRRGPLLVMANLTDTPGAPIELPAPAVYDTDEDAVTPMNPRVGSVRLAPQQALVLVDSAALRRFGHSQIGGAADAD